MTKKSRTKRFSAQYLTICHCNLNSIAGHNFIKVALLKAYFSVHEMEIKCLFDIYLDSSVPVDDDSLQIPGYISVRVYHPSNTKRGGI